MLIGILGKKGHGKDTVSDYMVKKYNFQKEILAQPIKDVSKILFGFTDEQLYTDLKESVDPVWQIKPRSTFQWIGDVCRQDIHRILPNLGQNFFINRIINIYETSKRTNDNTKIVISDCRFKNEFNHIKNAGGIIIKIVRPSVNNIDTHASETEIDEIQNYDYLIVNDGTIDELYNKIDNILSPLIK